MSVVRFLEVSCRLCSVGLMALLVLVGCAEDERGITEPEIEPSPSCGRVLIVTTDYATGGITVVDADSSFSSFDVRRDVAGIGADAIARVHDGLVYVVNRLGDDNVQVLDPEAGFRTVRQFSVGPGSNPHDIAFVSEDRAYVSRNGSTSLIEIDPWSGEIRAEVSLAALADGDGIPDMDRLFYRDPYLYVAIQRIDFGGGTYLPVAPSYLAVVDVRENSLVDFDPGMEGIQGIVLDGLNPIAPMVWDDTTSTLLVPCAGVFGLLDGGIERIDLSTGESAGWLVLEENLGGDLIDFALTDSHRGYATISNASFITSLVAFDRFSGSLLETVFVSDGYELADLALTSCGDLVFCDRDYANPGLRVVDAETGRAIPGIIQPIPTGLPPFEILVLDGTARSPGDSGTISRSGIRGMTPDVSRIR